MYTTIDNPAFDLQEEHASSLLSLLFQISDYITSAGRQKKSHAVSMSMILLYDPHPSNNYNASVLLDPTEGSVYILIGLKA